MQEMGLPVSILFPCVSGGGMIITYVVSRVLFKEKMTRAQTVGFFVSVASVVFLNL
jgi:multidrug transporter EmrE-like cation transporter